MWGSGAEAARGQARLWIKSYVVFSADLAPPPPHTEETVRAETRFHLVRIF
eukprot:SAG31_NODE_2646_length_5307_cov_1.777074_5_plen_51_part_00